MKQNYSRNHKIITFQPDDIVTLRIPKEDQAATDNYKLVVMIKSIPHEERHQIQTKFGILDRLYPTGKLNVISSVDQDGYRKDSFGAPTKLITLHAVAAKIGTSNKPDVSCNCKKSCTPQSRCKCQKNKVEFSQYCHNSRRVCGNAGSLKTGTDVKIVPRKKETSEDENTSDGENSKPRSQKLKERARTLTNSNCNRKRNKILPEKLTHQNVESETEIQQTALSQYENIAPVVNRLQGMRNRGIKGKKGK